MKLDLIYPYFHCLEALTTHDMALPGCVQYSMCSACSQHRGQSWANHDRQGDGPSPLLILCSLIGNSLATGAELDQKALVESGAKAWEWRASGEGRWGNERLLVSPLLIIIGCSRLTAQETTICRFLHEFREIKSLPGRGQVRGNLFPIGKSFTCGPNPIAILHIWDPGQKSNRFGVRRAKCHTEFPMTHSCPWTSN